MTKKQRRSSEEVQIAKTLKNDINEVVTKRLRFKALNHKQKEFSNLITDNQITLALGSPGSGKSYISIFKALELLQLKTNNYQKIKIFTPIVSVGETLGYFPGSMREKIEPYISTSLELLDKIIGKGNRLKLEEMEIVEISAIELLRGANIDNTILIMEEAQNMSKPQMKTLLTRLGSDSKFIISGDLDQSDKYKNSKQSGLYDAHIRLKDVPDIGMVEFEDSDIVRNPLIGKILSRYRETRSDVDKVDKILDNKIKKVEKKSFWGSFFNFND